MAKREKIIKYLTDVKYQLEDEYSEHGQVQLNDFELGVLYGVETARWLLGHKMDKDIKE